MVIDPDLPRPFDPDRFARRLERARKVAHTYPIERLARTAYREIYEVDGNKPYFVKIDLSGRGRHWCSCPDGAVRVMIAGSAVSLCKHVLACILKGGRMSLLMPYICVRSISGSPL